jgi:hypothetical protein
MRFLSSTEHEVARAEAETFLVACFESLGVREVVRSGAKHPVGEASKIMSTQLMRPAEPAGAGSNLLNRIMQQDLTMETCQGITTLGVNFQIEQLRDLRGGTVYYRPGPLPVIELGVLYFAERQSPKEWAARLLSSQAVHVLCTVTHLLRRQSIYGTGDNRYLFWKRGKLPGRPMGDEAMQAGFALRELCRVVWKQRRRELARLEAPKWWFWFRTRLLRAFDEALIEEAGREELEELLKAMSTTVDRWLEV